ncbi:MAG TPA: PQQ-binding-like beta-propeller repeat protein, partial [Rhizomicrobium sp.]|nr:PQQ-binding-like beta-propeller repeat protein [Rhizomicrobium sp.]
MIKGPFSIRLFSALAAAAALGGTGIWMSHAMAQTGGGPFTEAQAQAGQPIYASRCASCHDAGGETARLMGPAFTQGWKSRSTRDLYTRIKTTMPFNNPGSLSEAEAASVVAYILKSNGATPGSVQFTPTTTVAIASIVPEQRRDPYAGYVSLSGMAAATGITFPGTVAHYTPVTEEMLLNPPPSDWLMHYQNYAGWSHSPLNQINTGNVQNLQLRWVWSLEDGERQQITPLVHDGVMFVSTVINNTVQALNAATGDLIWENRLGPRLENQVNATARAMALYGDQLFYPASDATMYALDARTGKVNWKFKMSNYGRDKIGGVMIADGKIVVGLGVCDEPSLQDRCFIAAYDVKDGHQIWKFNTVAYQGEPGGNTWGNMTNGERSGADAWIAGTYDPKLRLIYFGTGQAKAGKNGIGDKLYSNSTIALDVDTGKLKWYNQSAPDEGLDLDEVYEKVLVDEGPQKLLLTAGKKGILWKLDRTTGQFLDYVPTVFLNVFTSIDRKTGRATYRPDILQPVAGGSRSSCPSAAGGIGFIGDWDRSFRAFDVKTGKTLWKTRLGTTAQGFPTT